MNSLEDITLLREWLSSNMETSLNINVLGLLSAKTQMTEVQLYDFLHNEKRKIRKNLKKFN